MFPFLVLTLVLAAAGTAGAAEQTLPAAASPAPGAEATACDVPEPGLAERAAGQIPDGELVGLRPADRREVADLALRFYERRKGCLAWLLASGSPRPEAAELVAVLRRFPEHGLPPVCRPEDLAAGLDRAASASREERLDLDLTLTRAFLAAGLHLLRGRVLPEDLKISWDAQPREADMTAVLATGLDSGTIETALLGLAPVHPEYNRLREALACCRRLASSSVWPEVPEGPPLQPGDKAPPERLAALKWRLEANEQISLARMEALASPADPTTGSPISAAEYDEELAAAVRRFQARYGLQPDGIVGPETLGQLNRSPADRERQIEVNMERWRWIPDDLGKDHVRVNVPAFRLAAYRDGALALGMRVIVGREGWGTPIFSDRIQYIVIHPYWNVPNSIAVAEILPQLQREPDYLARHDMEVLTSGGEAVDAGGINWKDVEASGFPYRLRQRPGPDNPLGRLKFMFPNHHAVYLHDTPPGRLFESELRALSHGCVRVEKPIDLAVAVLNRAGGEWTRERVEQELAKPGRRVIQLPEPLPVHLLYWTAHVAGDEIEFYPDLYGLDAAMDQAWRQLAGTEEAGAKEPGAKEASADEAGSIAG